MDSDSGAGLLHRLTSYVPTREWNVPVDDPRVRHDLVPNDLDTVPPPMKDYPDQLPVLALPRDLPDLGVSATAILAGATPPAPLLDAAQLGRVLFLGAGVVRTAERNGRRTLFRASGSAGARFPMEVYASTRGVAGVPDGVHWYDGERHALVQVGPAAVGEVTTLVVTGVPWRTGWRYAERGWRHLYWDTGTLLSQLSAAAASAGLEPRLRSLFPDAAVRDLVGADGVHEYPLALLSLGDGEPAIGSTGPAALGELPPVELPLCTAAQRAGERGDLGEPWPQPTALPDVPPSDSLDVVVRRRGSQRRMDRSRTLSRAAAGVAADRGPAGRRGAALGRCPRCRRRDTRDLPVARPVDAAARRRPARRAGADLPRPDARGRRGLRRHRGHAILHSRRSRLPRGPTRRRAGRGPAASRGVRAGRERIRDDVPRLRGASPAGRARRPHDPAVHLRRRPGIRLAPWWRPGRAGHVPSRCHLVSPGHDREARIRAARPRWLRYAGAPWACSRSATKHPNPIPTIEIDRFLGDDAARRLHDRLVARDWASARDILSQPMSTEQFGLMLITAADVEGVEAWIDDAVTTEPQSTLPLLVKGARHVYWAWEARGTGRSDSVAKDAWNVWFNRLKVAEDCLDEVVERDPHNVEAWHWLIVLGRARQVSTEERWRRFNGLIAVDPHHYYGNSQMLEGVKEKWSGSHDEMFRFARERAQSGPATMLPLLVVESHLEYRWGNGGLEYMERADVGDDLVAAAHQSLWHPDYRPTVQTRILLNNFAFAFALADRFDEAERCFAEIGDDRVTRRPWGDGNESAAKSFLRLRTYVRANLPK